MQNIGGIEISYSSITKRCIAFLTFLRMNMLSLVMKKIKSNRFIIFDSLSTLFNCPLNYFIPLSLRASLQQVELEGLDFDAAFKA